MSIFVPDEGGLAQLQDIFGAADFTLQLLTDSAAIADADTVTTHAVASGGGYADKTLLHTAAAFALNSGVPEVSWPLVTWIFTGTLDGTAQVTGYQVKKGGVLYFAERWPEATFEPVYEGKQISFTPRYRLGNGVPT